MLDAGRAVDSTFTLAPEPEVLDDIGQVGVVAVDARTPQGAVQQPPRGSDERLALDVLPVSGLLAHQHQSRAAATLPEDRLGGLGVQLAGGTPGRLATQLGE